MTKQKIELNSWEVLAIEVALQRQQREGGFEKQSLEKLLKKIEKINTRRNVVIHN